MKVYLNTGHSWQLPQELLGEVDQLAVFDETHGDHKIEALHCCLLAEEMSQSQIVDFVLSGKGNSILQSSSENQLRDLRSWALLRQNPQGYFDNPIQTILIEGQALREFDIMSPAEKDQVRQQLEAEVAKVGNASCVEDARTIFEELYMNAMIDAPRENGGLIRPGGVRIRLGCDSTRLAISCEDLYGSLSFEKLLKRLKQVYRDGAGESINMREQGGAGLGCVIMLEKSNLVVFGLEPGRRTTVTCLIDRKASYRKRSEIKKGIHFLVFNKV